MHLVHLEVENFRSLENLKIDLKEGANLLVGPNAVGKSTVLEAIRLAKAVLAPRTSNEMRQVLTSLGAMSSTQQLNMQSIAKKPHKSIRINCTYRLTDNEVTLLPKLNGQLADSVVAAQQGIDLNSSNGELGLVQFFSTPFGKTARTQALLAIQDPVAKMLKERECHLNLTLEESGRFSGDDSISQLAFALLERRLPPSKALLSYFPADRAMAGGDAQIQIGSADATQQLESHNSQPALKYQRLKNVIFSTLLSGNTAAEQQREVFQNVFIGLLKEKSLGAAEVNRFGQATVMIHDAGAERAFDIDSMSSGEKGLILTFLLIARSIEDGGLVLLDEPELHLNSGVCKNLLDFLMDEYLRKHNIQAIICTHSPEIMSAAVRREDCNVFNMRRNGPISLIRRSDHIEAAQALRLLGTSEIEALLFDAVIFVEGPDDVELLEFAFRDFLSRLRFRELTGRGEVEKYIKLLINADKAGKGESTKFFIFDKDNKPTGLTSTEHVKLRQWERYCLENYIIEPEILYDTVKLDLRPNTWPETFTDALSVFKNIAKKQLRSRIIDKIYKDSELKDVRLRTEEKKDTFTGAATSLYTKFERLSEQMTIASREDWIATFSAACEAELQRQEAKWADNWISDCSGKQFITDIYSYSMPKVDISSFKRTLLGAHKVKNSESWKLLRANIEELVSKIK